MSFHTVPFLSSGSRSPSSSPSRVANPNAFWGLSSPARVPTTRSYWSSPFLSLSSPLEAYTTINKNSHTTLDASPSSNIPSQRYKLSSPFSSSPYCQFASYGDYTTSLSLLSPTSPIRVSSQHAALRSTSQRTAAAQPLDVFLSRTPSAVPPAGSWSPFLPATDPVFRTSDFSKTANVASSPSGTPSNGIHAQDRVPSAAAASPLPALPHTPLMTKLAQAAIDLSSPLTPLESPMNTPSHIAVPFRRALRGKYDSPSSTSTVPSPPQASVNAHSDASSYDGSVSPIKWEVAPAQRSAARETRSRTRTTHAATPPLFVPVPGTLTHAPSKPNTLDATLSAITVTKKRRRASAAQPSSKKPRVASQSTVQILSNDGANSHATNATINVPETFTNRTFPDTIPIYPNFTRLYRNFPACSFISSDRTHPVCPDAVRPEGAFNPPRDVLDLYTPRYTKGISKTKTGMCPVCAEPVARGGEGKKVWLAMKQSAYNYHMMYYHGLSPLTGLPFSPPIAFRTASHEPKSRVEKTELLEGRCEKCDKWIPVETVKRDHNTKVKEHFWWKHAATCHGDWRLPGDTDVFVTDDVHRAITAAAQRSAEAIIKEDNES